MVYRIYLDFVEALGMTWIEGCRGRGETFRDKCNNARKQYLQRGYIFKLFPTLEEKAMAFLTERQDFMEKHEVGNSGKSK